MKTISLLITLGLLLSFCSAESQNLTIKQKKNIMTELSSAIEKNYVLHDSVSIIQAEMKDAQQSADFKRDYAPTAFASYLTQLLRSITMDAHFAVLHDPQMFQTAVAIQEEPPGNGPAPAIAIGGRNLSDHRTNYYFKKLEILDGNVGYLKITQMPSLESAQSTVDASMTFLQNTDALIIDLRSNPGGVGGFIPYLISYFMEGRHLLYTREFLAWDSISYHHTHENLGANRYLNKPVYILTNRFTGSAATNMTYTMQSFDLAEIVGENTGAGYRGAHSATLFPLDNDLVGIVPIGRVVNAKTKTNWRSNGVDPDIECDPDEALEVAYKQALSSLIQRSSDPKIKEELQKILVKLASESKNANDDKNELAEYAGKYEDTTITFENGKLFTKKPTVPIKLEMQRKDGDLFKIILPENTLSRGNLPDLRFNREKGSIVSLTTIRDGVEELTEKKN